MESFNSKYTAAQIEALLDKINNLDISKFVSSEDIEDMATKSDLSEFVTSDDISSFITSEALEDYVTHDELQEALSEIQNPQEPQEPQEPENDTWTIQYIVDGTNLAPITETVAHGTDYSSSFEPSAVSDLGEYNDEDYDEPIVVADVQNKTITVTYSVKQSEPEEQHEEQPEEQGEP